MGDTTTFAELIAAPLSEKVFLVELKLAEEATGFTLTSGKTYTYELAYLNETVTLADGSTETIRKAVVACEIDGVAATAKTSIAEVEATAGTYWHDTANSLLYVHVADDTSPTNNTVIVYFWAYFATKGIVLDSRYYEPYIASNGIPALSQASQQIHWGASQISSGEIVLINSRGYFDQIASKWIWNNKDAKILLGGDSLAYSEYTTIFAGKIMEATFTRNEFSLTIQSKAFDLLRSLPINNFWTDTWPNLEESAEGKPIPYYWGVYDAAQAPLVTCINTAYGTNAYQYKICDCTYHAIKDITQVYIDYGGGLGWQLASHSDEDLTNGTFVLTSDTIVIGTTRVKVAFEGYHSGGTVIEGAPEIVEDILLNQCGYASGDLNAASFTASKANSLVKLNVGIEKDTVAMTIIEQICQSDLAFFDEDGDGALRYRTWEPSATSATDVIDKHDIISDPEIKEDTSHLYYKVRVGYSHLYSQDKDLYAEKYNDESRYKYGRDDYLTIGTYIREQSQAKALADKINWITRTPSPIVSLTLKAGLIDLTLGDLFKLTLERAPYATAGGYSERVFEIIGKDVSCFPVAVKLTARDLMDFGSNVGFWMGPAAPIWADATPAEREDSGFWCDANGYCLTADTASRYKSLWW